MKREIEYYWFYQSLYNNKSHIEIVYDVIPEMLKSGDLKQDNLFGAIWDNILSYLLEKEDLEGIKLWSHITKRFQTHHGFRPELLVYLDKHIPTALIPDSLREAIMAGALEI